MDSTAIFSNSIVTVFREQAITFNPNNNGDAIITAISDEYFHTLVTELKKNNFARFTYKLKTE